MRLFFIAVCVLAALCCAKAQSTTILCTFSNTTYVPTNYTADQVTNRLARGDFPPYTVRGCFQYDANCNKIAIPDGGSCRTTIGNVCVSGQNRCINNSYVCIFGFASDATIPCDMPNALNQVCNTTMPGACKAGTTQCVNGQVTCVPNKTPVPEIPFNGIDDNCDCRIDESNMDGSGNNQNSTLMGATGTPLVAFAGYRYADGIGQMVNGSNARNLSNILSQMTRPPDRNDRRMSSMLWQWGQFIDHDIALIHDGTEFVPIPVPTGDPFLDPSGFGNASIPFFRSQFVGGVTTPRQPLSNITMWLDGSNVYGSDAERATFLRAGTGGRLKMTADGFPPPNTPPNQQETAEPPNVVGYTPDFFVCGDIRCNEQVGLSALHTLFLREHNYWADRLAARFPAWNDDAVYMMARTLVVAEINHIHYEEFLPALLGPNDLECYAGYNASVDGSIANEFSSAAYRIGHTLLNDFLRRYNEDGTVFAGGHLSLRQAFFLHPTTIMQPGCLDALFRGYARQMANEIDVEVVESVRSFLFGNNGGMGLDLVALNIQRGRDHGLARYNDIRAAYGLPRTTTFADITANTTIQARLAAAYATVDDIDPFIAFLAEDHLPGSSMGPSHTAIIKDQFRRLRAGNRMFYLNDPVLTKEHPDLLNEVEHSSLSTIILRNTNITRLQSNVFFAACATELPVADDLPRS